MKAIRVREFGGPEVLKIETVPDPEPGPGEVMVEVRAAGVNPVDTYIRAGTYANKPAVPYTPGSDAAGTVASVGRGVTRFRPGDRVFTARTLNGAYAQRTLCRESQAQPLPANVTFSQGAAVGVPYGTAYRGLFQRARARAGETVLVHGASGGVGTAAVQIARSAGLTVYGTAGTPKGKELAQKEGAHRVFDHHEPDYTDQILKATDGRGVDVILEMLANVNLGKDLGLLAPKGRVVVIGSRGTVTVDPRMAMSRDAAILGMSLINASAEELAEAYAAIVEGLEKGRLRPIIGQELPLAEAARAHTMVLEPGSYGKIVLVP